MIQTESRHTYATVRIASPADLVAIRAVATETWHATYSAWLKTSTIDSFLRRAYSDYSLLATLNNGGLWLLEEDGRVVGYLRVSMNDDVGYLGAIYVLPRSQGRGHGRRMWECAVAWFAARGAREVRLTVAQGNEHAKGFYRHLGFEEREIHNNTLLGEPLVEQVFVRPIVQDYLF